MFLPILELVADSSVIFAFVVLVELYALHTMSSLLDAVNSIGAGPPPDMRYGFTYDELYHWIEGLGEDGREAYMRMVAFDLFPYCEAYAILLGSLLLQQLRQTTSLTTSYALIFPVTMMCDLLETFIPAYAVQNYPDTKLQPLYVEIAATANQLKWICFGSGLILTSGLFVYNSFRPAAHQAPEAKRD